jgi:RNA polymerase sigma-70 factor (ECF subfamily)
LGEMDGLSDAELVSRVLAGDVDLYRVLVERYRLEFGRYATAMLGGDADDAADALQEALIRAFDSLASCRDPGRFKAWLFRIVSNQCHNWRRRRREHVSLESVSSAADDAADATLQSKELSQTIAAALNDLTDEQREAFVMKHVEGRSYAEMAELLGVGEDALKMRVYRARDELKQRLESLQ